MTQTPFKNKWKIPERNFQMVHSDTFGPFEVSANGNRYMLVITDIKTTFVWPFPMKRKSDAAAIIEEWIKMVKVHHKSNVEIWHDDEGGEFMAKDFRKMLKKLAIVRTVTDTATPEMNPFAERAGRTLVEMTRAMLFSAGLPKWLWVEAFIWAATLKNMRSSRRLGHLTPWELLKGEKPNMKHIFIFGSPLEFKDNRHGLQKLQSRSRSGLYLGYDFEQHTYRILEPGKKLVTFSRSVKVDESEILDQHEQPRIQKILEGAPLGNKPPTPLDDGVEELDLFMFSDYPEQEEENPRPAPPVVPQVPAGDPPVVIPPPPPVINQPPLVPPPIQRQQPKRSSRQKPVDRLQPSKNKKRNNVRKAFCLNTKMLVEYTEPSTYKQAVTGIDKHLWIAAIRLELERFRELGVWKNVPRKKNYRYTRPKWVFAVKLDGDGNYVKHRARVVCMGNTQVHGVNYDQTYAPVVRLESFRLLLAISAKKGWKVWHLDVKTAFLNADIDEYDIYMTFPEGYMGPMDPSMCLKLLKSMYGLKQAGRLWSKKLFSVMRALGFVQSKNDPCVFISPLLIVAIYTDDILLAGPCFAFYSKVKAALIAEFDMNDEGEVSTFCSIRVQKTENGFRIDQQAYIRRVLEEFNMVDCKPQPTPMQDRPSLNVNTEPTYDCPYRSAIGKFRYLVDGTMPNLALAVSILSSYQNNYREEEWTAVKRVMRYLKHVSNQYIEYGCSDEIYASSDASYAMEPDAKSRGGWFMMVYGGPISWNSKKQTITAQSSMEAELITLNAATKESRWLTRLLLDMQTDIPTFPLKIKEDNQATIDWCKNPIFHSKTKHIPVRYHYVREQLEEGKIALNWTPTNDMEADMHTKPLAKILLKKHCSAAGLQYDNIDT